MPQHVNSPPGSSTSCTSTCMVWKRAAAFLMLTLGGLVHIAIWNWHLGKKLYSVRASSCLVNSPSQILELWWSRTHLVFDLIRSCTHVWWLELVNASCRRIQRLSLSIVNIVPVLMSLHNCSFVQSRVGVCMMPFLTSPITIRGKSFNPLVTFKREKCFHCLCYPPIC